MSHQPDWVLWNDSPQLWECRGSTCCSCSEWSWTTRAGEWEERRLEARQWWQSFESWSTQTAGGTCTSARRSTKSGTSSLSRTTCQRSRPSVSSLAVLYVLYSIVFNVLVHWIVHAVLISGHLAMETGIDFHSGETPLQLLWNDHFTQCLLVCV